MDARLPLRACVAIAALLLCSAVPGSRSASAAQAQRADSAGEPESEVGKVEIHGYGDFEYSNPRLGTMSRGATNEIDIRAVELAWEYAFTKAMHFEAEVEFEHGADEIELEQAMLEHDLTPSLSLRLGSLLVPVGLTNEAHDPPLYYSVQRAYVEQIVIPTTWPEAGLGLAGHTPDRRLEARAYVMAGLDATGFRSLDGISGGRTNGAESKADDLAGVGRIEASPAEGVTLGASGYGGGADQHTAGLGQVRVTLLDADARIRRGGADIRGLLAWTGIYGAERVSSLVGQTVGKEIVGWYLEAAYDVLGRGRPRRDGRALYAFARFEELDTNRRVPTGYAPDPAADRQVLTSGISYYPIGTVAFKADLERWRDGSGATLDRVNLGAAFMF